MPIAIWATHHDPPCCSSPGAPRMPRMSAGDRQTERRKVAINPPGMLPGYSSQRIQECLPRLDQFVSVLVYLVDRVGDVVQILAAGKKDALMKADGLLDKPVG